MFSEIIEFFKVNGFYGILEESIEPRGDHTSEYGIKLNSYWKQRNVWKNIPEDVGEIDLGNGIILRRGDGARWDLSNIDKYMQNKLKGRVLTTWEPLSTRKK